MASSTAKGLIFLLASFTLEYGFGFTKPDSIRPHYVKIYDKQFFIGPAFSQRSASFQLINALHHRDKITYRPNNEFTAGVRAHIFGVGVEGSLSVPQGKKSSSRLGSSDMFDLSFNSVGEKWITELGFQHFNGFYLNPSWQKLGIKDVFPQRSDIDLRTVNLSTVYIFNHEHFSEESPYLFSEHQIHSSGSFLFGLMYARFKISASSALISTADQSHFAKGADYKHLDFISFGVLPGYSYTFVHKNAFLNVTGQAGPAHYWNNYRNETGGDHYDIDLNFVYSYRLALGYNGDTFFYGITYSSKNTQSQVQNTRMSGSSSTLRILAGMRIKEKGVFTKRMIDLERWLGLKKKKPTQSPGSHP